MVVFYSVLSSSVVQYFYPLSIFKLCDFHRTSKVCMCGWSVEIAQTLQRTLHLEVKKTVLNRLLLLYVKIRVLHKNKSIHTVYAYHTYIHIIHTWTCRLYATARKKTCFSLGNVTLDQLSTGNLEKRSESIPRFWQQKPRCVLADHPWPSASTSTQP